MNREESPKLWLGVIPDHRRHKLAVLKEAITEGAYKVKAEDIADKILKGRLFELAHISFNHEYQKCGDNESISWPRITANNLCLTCGEEYKHLAEMRSFPTFSGGTLR
jgi:hypothetical protein